MSTRLSPNFWAHEFRCSCGCGDESVSPVLVSLLQSIRDKSGPLKISSGVRCKASNAKLEGAAKNSWHVPRRGLGHAADVKYASGNSTPGAILKLYVLADQLGARGLGLYSNRIHVDVRTGGRARWVHSSWSWRNT